MDDKEGLRKRQRTMSPDEDVDITHSQVELDKEPIVRDALYYREDGDCVILVGRVLFKVRKFYCSFYHTGESNALKDTCISIEERLRNIFDCVADEPEYDT
jgi:hypothetical protein